MVRDRNVYRCQQCGFASPKPGTCPDCKRMTGELMALVEERAAPEPGGRRIGLSSSRPRALSDITMEHTDRLRTGIGELDRVLGGGVVPGSLVLIGGDPGIGKSTLLIQAARALATAAPPVLYVSAEESAAQVKLRAERLGISSDGLLLWTETDLVTVEAELDTVKPKVLIIDSIQTVFLPTLESAPGSVAQVRECGGRLMTIAKGRGIATFLVGHVTKEGALAGPRVLEHLVDTVLYFEGESHHAYRMLRAVKNRFGSTNEIGVFQMGEAGLVEVTNPSGFFLAERPGDAPGAGRRRRSRRGRAHGRGPRGRRARAQVEGSGRARLPARGRAQEQCPGRRQVAARRSWRGHRQRSGRRAARVSAWQANPHDQDRCPARRSRGVRRRRWGDGPPA